MPLSSITSIVMHNAQKGHEEIWQIWIIDWCQLESESLWSTEPVSIHTTPAESTADLPVSIGFELNETLRTWIILWCFKKHACPISANMLNYIQHIKVMILRISQNCEDFPKAEMWIVVALCFAFCVWDCSSVLTGGGNWDLHLMWACKVIMGILLLVPYWSHHAKFDAGFFSAFKPAYFPAHRCGNSSNETCHKILSLPAKRDVPSSN